MKKPCLTLLIATFALLGIQHTKAQSKTYDVSSFNEVIISPHIEVIFEKADTESVVIESIDVSMNKLNVEVKGNTLHIYLDDAKVFTKSEKTDYDDYKGKHAIYHGTVVSAKIYFTSLEEISLRGDETHKVESILKGEELSLKIYGESEVYFNEIEVDKFIATMYGESYLKVKEGSAKRQRIISYGEGEIDTFGVKNSSAKVTAYGEGRVKLNVSDDLKITAYGEASIDYKGSPVVNRGLVLGDASIHQVN